MKTRYKIIAVIGTRFILKSIIPSILASIAIFFAFQMILPFPYGLVFGLIIPGLIIWYTRKHIYLDKDSLLNYRRIDPIDEKERKENEEAQRSLDKKYLEENVSKKEYKKRKKDFEDTEDIIKKCHICGSTEFEFVAEYRVEEPGEPVSDDGYYRCKKCGTK